MSEFKIITNCFVGSRGNFPKKKRQFFYTIIVYFLSGQFGFIATSQQCKKTFFFVTISRFHSIHHEIGICYRVE